MMDERNILRSCKGFHLALEGDLGGFDLVQDVKF
jgi:hypothetical protein